MTFSSSFPRGKAEFVMCPSNLFSFYSILSSVGIFSSLQTLAPESCWSQLVWQPGSTSVETTQLVLLQTQRTKKAQAHTLAEVGRDLEDTCSTLCSSRVTTLPRTVSWWLLTICKDEDSITFLGNLCQGVVTLTVKRFFLMFRGGILCFSLCHCLWFWHWAPLKRVFLCPCYSFHLYITSCQDTALLY